MYRTVVCVLVVLAASGSACWMTGDDPETTPVAPAARALPSPTLTPVPTASPTPTPTSSLTPSLVTPYPTTAAYWQTVERNGEIEGYGYVPRDARWGQIENSDLIARVRHLSVEPSYRIDSYADPERRYSSYVHFSFSIIETLWGIWGTPPGDEVVVEYSVHGSGPTKTQAIEEAKKWIASERDAWWNKQEAIIFLEDLRFVGGEKPENSTGAHYRFPYGVGSCNDHFPPSRTSSHCPEWEIGDDNYFGSWVWLPFVGQDASLEVPDSERMFHVVVVPYGANAKEHRTAPASLANIKTILEPFQEAYWSKSYVRQEYVGRYLDLWEANGSDSYSFVYSVGDEGGHFLSTEKIVVRNGEVVEVFSAEDGDQWLKVWSVGSERKQDWPTLESSSHLWHDVVVRIIGENWPFTDVSFDYEIGYPTAFRWFRRKDEPDLFIYISEYTPLDD